MEPPVGFEPTTPALQDRVHITPHGRAPERAQERASLGPDNELNHRRRESKRASGSGFCGLHVDSMPDNAPAHDTDRNVRPDVNAALTDSTTSGPAWV